MENLQSSWYALRLTVPPEAVEAAEFALNSLDALGLETELIRPSASTVVVTGYFDHSPQDDSVQDEIHYAFKVHDLDETSILSIERDLVKNTDWLAEWKKHWKPVTLGNFVIAAPWHEVDQPGKFVIRIEPNMAFGTGTHETTQLCLKAIDELYAPGDSFLDVGTGTGILAIAAALKGRNTSGSECAPDEMSAKMKIEGYDVDPDAVSIAKENAGLNGVGSEIRFQVGAIDEATLTFDFICANLTLDVILPILPLLLEKAKKQLVLSGILKTQERTIVNELKKRAAAGFRIETAGEWIAAIVKNNRAA